MPCHDAVMSGARARRSALKRSLVFGRPPGRVVLRAGVIPAARTIDVPSEASRHAGESRYSRLYADGHLNDVDTGFRRHDEIGAAAESIVWAVGINRAPDGVHWLADLGGFGFLLPTIILH